MKNKLFGNLKKNHSKVYLALMLVAVVILALIISLFISYLFYPENYINENNYKIVTWVFLGVLILVLLLFIVGTITIVKGKDKVKKSTKIMMTIFSFCFYLYVGFCFFKICTEGIQVYEVSEICEFSIDYSRRGPDDYEIVVVNTNMARETITASRENYLRLKLKYGDGGCIEPSEKIFYESIWKRVIDIK